MPTFYSQIPDASKPWFMNQIQADTGLFLTQFQAANLRALQYLMFVNAGGTIATASFIATADLYDNSIVISLFFFIGGMILAGILNAFAYHVSKLVVLTWVANIKLFYADQISWEKLFERTESSAPKVFLYLDPIVGYGSFGMFIAGCYFALSALLLRSDVVNSASNLWPMPPF